jgi:hypothetical protein
MDQKTFDKFTGELDAKISMVDEFIQRAHGEGISVIEAAAMQNHVRREFSTKQRVAFRQQISSLYRGGNISIEQKDKIERLLDKASQVADQHFLRLSRIVPEGQAITSPRGMPSIFNQDLGDSKAKKVMRFLGFGDSS